MSLEETLSKVNPSKLLDILVSLYEQNKELQKPLDMIFAGLDDDPKKIVLLIKKEIASLKRSKRYIDYYESSALADHLNQLRLRIIEDVLAKSPKHAWELMLEFLDLHEKTFDRVDDSNGSVGDVFRDACENLGNISNQTNYPINEIVQIVFERFMKNDYGIYDDIILHFKNTLGVDGLQQLYTQLHSAHTTTNSRKISSGLKSIADCRNNVDEYIRACSLNGAPIAYDHLDIAKRLMDHWRAEEVLQWLERMDIPSNHGWESQRLKLKIQALELNGEYALAQEERIAWFDKSLSPELYGEILKHSKESIKESFKVDAVLKALKFNEPHAALNFLIKAQEFEAAGKLIRQRLKEFHGREYSVLRGAAEILESSDPLAATLLYRRMMEAILEEAKYKYYNYAAKDYVRCGLLNTNIVEWEAFQSHNEYSSDLKEKHKRTSGFWEIYQVELHKQTAKKTKELEKRHKNKGV
ncbi:MAG: hypothetical protein Q8Q56_01095 [Alphaproteobacteria bacterium]|nr:hypothetical protein [Alphaproteobacteria bacterium]